LFQTRKISVAELNDSISYKIIDLNDEIEAQSEENSVEKSMGASKKHSKEKAHILLCNLFTNFFTQKGKNIHGSEETPWF